MGTDWLDLLLRLLAVSGMSYGAYQGYRQMRENGTWSRRIFLLQGALLLLYVSGGLLIVAVYVVYFHEDHTVAGLIISVAYFVGGLYPVWKLAARITAKFAPKVGDPKQVTQYPPVD